jgi:repressor LexA
MGLTAAQERVYRFVREFIDKNGYSPSYEEICRHLGFASKNSVAKHMRQLEDRGYVKSISGRRRSLELIPVRTSSVSIPFLGIVTAGIPIEAIEVPESIDVPESFLGNGNNFALRVRGDSMIEEGIRDGDIIVIGKQPSAENGQTVVAMIRGEATVKKFHRSGDRIELRPANHAMKPIYATEDEVEVVGVVVGLLRDYKHRPAL